MTIMTTAMQSRYSKRSYRAHSKSRLNIPVTPSTEACATIRARGKTYGPAEKDFQRTADLWSALHQHRHDYRYTAADVAQMMRMVKESRLIESPEHHDSLVDICGYADLQEEVSGGAPHKAAVEITPIQTNDTAEHPEDFSWGKCMPKYEHRLPPVVTLPRPWENTQPCKSTPA